MLAAFVAPLAKILLWLVERMAIYWLGTNAERSRNHAAALELARRTWEDVAKSRRAQSDPDPLYRVRGSDRILGFREVPSAGDTEGMDLGVHASGGSLSDQPGRSSLPSDTPGGFSGPPRGT